MSQVEVVLLQAIESNDLAQVRFALRAGESWRINEQDDKGITALHRSCLHGRLDIVCLFLDNGADLEIRDQRGWTALHFGASGGHIDVVTFLLNSCAADVAALSKDGKFPIDVANGEGMVFLLASTMLRAGKQALLLRYMPDSNSNTSLQSLESDRNSNRLSAPDGATSTQLSGSLSQEIFRASQQFLTERFSSYLDEKFNIKSTSVDHGLVEKKVGTGDQCKREHSKLTRNTSYPVCKEPEIAEVNPRQKRRRLSSFNSSFSADVLERFAVSETNLNRVLDDYVHDHEGGSDINRSPNFFDLTQNWADSDVWIT